MSIFKPFQFYANKRDIEVQAEKILQQMESQPNYAPQFPLDPTRVAEFLGLNVVWDRIPPDEQGQIAARILPTEKLIEINEDIPELRGGFGNSTIAHEIGHWVLHVNHDEAEGLTQQQALFSEISPPFLCRSFGELKGIEWQAQYFAGCLLMPRLILEEKAKNRNLTKWAHLYAMAKDLEVTISNLTTRLHELGWIHIPRNSKQIYLGKSEFRDQGHLFD
ncbi:MAG: ImmA/IrrE family metallo-endopeptidase [Phormidesmis sp. CAN_BIN36]|nr:ImmA/IrrE family metallo-endopeptidase [Phormidesmis sp. CAN_BIN36]